MIFERIILIALILVGVGAFLMAFQFGDGTAHGSDLVPLLSGGSLAGLSFIALLQPVGPTQFAETNNTWRLASVLGGTGAFLWLLPIVGYPFVTPLWVAGIMYSLGARNLLTITFISAALSTTTYILLARIAFVTPPMGVLGAL